jgi:hypothetical protein
MKTQLSDSLTLSYWTRLYTVAIPKIISVKNARAWVSMISYTANFFPIKSMGKPCVAKGPCNVHVNLTGIAGKPQICAKNEGKYEIKFCREKACKYYQIYL